LGEGKIAEDPSVTSSASTQACEFAFCSTRRREMLMAAGLVEKATEVAKQAYTAVVGESK